MRPSALLIVAMLAAAPALAAQDTLPPVRVPVDREARDSSATAERLNALTRQTVATVPPFGGERILPAGARQVITRDSIDWSGAITVADLLRSVPGVFLWRAGGIGRPEPAMYHGRGSSSVEYLLDGVPYIPVGPDSTAIDPSTLPLGLIDRIEIERWGSTLRVSLFTLTNDRAAARSHIVLAAGPGKVAHYEAAFDRRFASGLGTRFGLDYLKVPPPGGATGNFQGTHLLGEVSYAQPGRGGAAFQFVSSGLDRDEFSDGGTFGSRVEGRRTDLSFRAFLGGAADGTGLRADLVGTRASFDSMGIDQSISRAGAALSWRSPRSSAVLTAFYGSRWTTLDANATVGWTPAPLLTLALDGRYQVHEGDRSSNWLGARAGVVLPAGLSLYGSVRAGTAVATPSVLSSPEQDVREGELGVLWSTRLAGFDARAARSAAFVPSAYQQIPSVPVLDSTPAATWLSVRGYLRPIEWFTVAGSIAAPSGAEPRGAPPRHWTADATVRSRFLRTFRSGAFDLSLALGYEGWRSGVLGFDELGTAVVLPEAHFLRSHLQIAIESFSVFWQSRNLLNETASAVPGFRVPRYSGMFGVRWGFRN